MRWKTRFLITAKQIKSSFRAKKEAQPIIVNFGKFSPSLIYRLLESDKLNQTLIRFCSLQGLLMVFKLIINRSVLKLAVIEQLLLVRSWSETFFQIMNTALLLRKYNTTSCLNFTRDQNNILDMSKVCWHSSQIKIQLFTAATYARSICLTFSNLKVFKELTSFKWNLALLWYCEVTQKAKVNIYRNRHGKTKRFFRIFLKKMKKKKIFHCNIKKKNRFSLAIIFKYSLPFKK